MPKLLSRKAISEMLIAVGVAGGVVAMATAGLLVAAPRLVPPPAAPAEKLCTMDRKSVFEHSTIGRDISGQFEALKAKLQADIGAEKKKIDAQASRLSPLQVQQQLVRLQERVMADNARLDKVQAQAVSSVIKRISPIIAATGKVSGCTAIIDRINFIYVGSTHDLTAEVVKVVERDVPPLDPSALAQLYSGAQ